MTYNNLFDADLSTKLLGDLEVPARALYTIGDMQDKQAEAMRLRDEQVSASFIAHQVPDEMPKYEDEVINNQSTYEL